MTSSKRKMYADAKRSGLSQKDVEQLGFEYLDHDALVALLSHVKKLKFADEGGAFIIPYFNTDGDMIKEFRVRFLDEVFDNGHKVIRYSQPTGQAGKFYFAPFIEWEEVLKDTSKPIYIVEGEKKAAYLCKLGFFAIGIGGVWNWMSDKSPIGDFALATWPGRSVYILFDADKHHKPNVMQAETALAQHVAKLGAIPYAIDLPGPEKGADDFGVAQGGTANAREAINALPKRNLLFTETQSFADILSKDIPEPEWAVENLIPVGLTILAGPPKLGKSWLCLSICVAKAIGGKVLGEFNAKPGGVLYLALEDTERRFQGRLKMTLARKGPPRNAHFVNSWPNYEAGGLLALRRWLDTHTDVKLVVIDTLAKIRSQPTGNGNAYYHDYEAVSELKRIADEYDIAVTVVHHTRKLESSDPIDQISGTTGLTGSADTLAVLTKSTASGMDGVLYTRGRDVEEQEIALKFNKESGCWTSQGNADFYRLSQARRDIINTLEDIGEAASPKDVAEATGKTISNIKKLMFEMHKEGLLKKPERGLYEPASRSNDRKRKFS